MNGRKIRDFLARFSFTSILTLITSKLWNGRKRFDLLARFSFTSILTLFNGKWWNGPKRLDLIARFSFTSICSLFTSKWWNGQKVHESPPPLPQPGRRKQEMPSLNRVNIVLSIYSF